ncbi:multidrug efflux system membrane fusion protein [Paucimonas lemoignei]|uniref:Multidrug efflux system membrane fusion protein n=1 Tax=Paucimonas lemoignei TaxID=29443 RepID=A0A4R3HWJ9_PAULE|nr:efflux RND transporter periplasmic adaptor subunit [Paucimonas lemoignei]TCS36963.1 multidrug efflux system membrane fusion protein [Paucimonas lemoignei]
MNSRHNEANPDSPATTRRTSRRKSLIGSVLAILLLAALGGLAWYLTHQGTTQGGPRAGAGGRRGLPPTTVGVATAEKADIQVTLDALGTVVAAATATVRPQVSGILQKVLFTEGQTVKAGQVLAIIDPRQFENQLMQATGQRQRDEAQLENARLTLKRYRTLLEQDSIARQDVDTQATLVKQLEGTVMTDRAAENTARLNLGYSRITAPISGRVGLRNVDVGNLVNAGDANGIAVITQLEPIDVQFAIPQDRVPDLRARINEGAKLTALAYDRSRTTLLDSGTFLALDNQVDTQTGTVRAKARFANAKSALFPSQFVNVRLTVNTIKDAVVVPANALRHGSKGDFVYVVNAADKTASLRLVTRGQASGDKIQIATGLKAGEQVITEGADRLKDGARVILPGERPAGGKGGKGFGNGAGKGAGDGQGGNRPVDADGKRQPAPTAGSRSENRAAQQPPAGAPSGKEASPAAANKVAGPTPEQRQRMLDMVKDDPEALARRKAFLDKIDQGDPEAIARWQQIQERRRDRGQDAGQ